MVIHLDVSINQLQQLTGKSYRTIKARIDGLEPVGTGRNNANLWESKKALQLIYGVRKKDEIALDATVEKAKLDQARRIEIERKHKEAMGELVDAEEVNRVWTNHIAFARTKLLAIGPKLAPALLNIDDPNKVKKEIDKLIYETLDDLSNDEAQEA